MVQEKAARINHEINVPEVRLIGVEGEQIGIVTLEVANAMAEETGIDLVEIAPTAQPPVCRLMDYGKFRYQESKKKHEAKLKQKQVQIKEVKFRPNTDDGDYNIKLRNLIGFLEEGDKAKVTLRFRGREMAHQEFGIRLLERVRDDLLVHAVVEQFPRMEGRQMVMVLSPKKKEVKLVKPKAVKPRVEKTTGDAVTAESDVSSVVSTEELTAEAEE
ncbi:MAG: translation initiation factor IF-3 [Nitrosomonadaceae bacterium]|nr:translation initiation factor IF-3 [Nitrosomonadaceae bacterium]MDW7647976.1 translation initiation factor IF-3 [Nitrosomonadaceae bacterium]